MGRYMNDLLLLLGCSLLSGQLGYLFLARVTHSKITKKKATQNNLLFHQVIKLDINSKTTQRKRGKHHAKVTVLCRTRSSARSQEQSVKVVTMLPLRCVTVLHCCFPVLWNLVSVLILSVLKEKVFSMLSNTSSKSPSPKLPC